LFEVSQPEALKRSVLQPGEARGTRCVPETHASAAGRRLGARGRMPASDGGLLGAHRPLWPARGVALAAGVVLCMALTGAWRADQGMNGEGAVRAVLLSKAHEAHAKHARAKHAIKKVGNKYRKELAVVEKGAGNDRSDEMKQIEALQRRSEGGGGSGKQGKGGKHLPPGLAEMQNLAKVSIHPGVEWRANLESISHRYYLCMVAFVREFIKETIHLLLGCLQGGIPLDTVSFVLAVLVRPVSVYHPEIDGFEVHTETLSLKRERQEGS